MSERIDNGRIGGGAAIDTPPAERAPRDWPIVHIFMAATVVSFLLIAAVFGFSFRSAYINASQLIGDKAALALASLEARTGDIFADLEEQIDFVGTMMEVGDIDPANRAAFQRLLTGSLAAARSVDAIGFVSAAGQLQQVLRDGDKTVLTMDISAMAITDHLLAETAELQKADWMAPIWNARRAQTFYVLRRPVRRDGIFLGALYGLISIAELSQAVMEVDIDQTSRNFILYGRDQVLAHSEIAAGLPTLNALNPLPALSQLRDPVLRGLWDPDESDRIERNTREDLEAYVIDSDNGKTYVVVLRPWAGLDGEPLIHGVVYNAKDIAAQLNNLLKTGGIGAAILILALVLALMFGRRLAQPIRGLAEAAAAIRDLNTEAAIPPPTGRFRELNQATNAFKAMSHTLQWFENYVPRSLVKRLVQDGAVVSSERRTLTVMFTDIANFTQLSENLPADQVARFLNDHFTLLAGAVEAEGGTIDKYMGDSLMAFWGAPDHMDDHAVAACRAAARMATDLAADNVRRRGAGLPVVHIRIGIHTGDVVVGNIGAPGRVNYTVVGDTVNMAQRLQSLSKEVGVPEHDANILVSAATAEPAKRDNSLSITPIGRFQLRGISSDQAVFRLTPKPEAV
jgi:class 3 adenylate cyclase